MQTFSRILPVTCIVAFTAPVALADEEPVESEPRFFVEALAGVSSFDFNSDYDEEEEIAGVRGGFNFTPHFAVEGEFIAGIDDNTFSYSSVHPVTDERIDTDVNYGLDSVISVFGKATLPVGDKFALHARMGVTHTKTTSTSRSVASESGEIWENSLERNEAGVAYGIGATFNLTDKIYTRADATRYEGFAEDLEAVTVSVGFKY